MQHSSQNAFIELQVGEAAYDASHLAGPQQPWGRAQGHYQDHMGTFNPITGHWSQEPAHPERIRYSRGRRDCLPASLLSSVTNALYFLSQSPSGTQMVHWVDPPLGFHESWVQWSCMVLGIALDCVSASPR